MKAILVFTEMPKSCDECEVRCGGYTAKEYSEKNIKRPSWCPLKPIVFCEECKYADELGEWSKYDYSCRHFNTHSVNKGNFCSYGEKKG